VSPSVYYHAALSGAAETAPTSTHASLQFPAAKVSSRKAELTRVLSYVWFVFVMSATSFLPDLMPVLRFRGWLVRRCFANCGRNFQIASGVRINHTTRLHLGNDVYIAPGCWLDAYGTVTLGDEVMLGPYTVIASSNHSKHDGSYRFGRPQSAPVRIGNGSWTGAHSTITAGTRLGAGVAVAAGGVVTKSVTDDCVVAGVPARVIRRDVVDSSETMASVNESLDHDQPRAIA